MIVLMAKKLDDVRADRLRQSLPDWILLSSQTFYVASLAVSSTYNERMPVEDICYLSQSAAEKAVKALLVSNGTKVEHKHDMQSLYRDVVESENIPQMADSMADFRKACFSLDGYSSNTRYPHQSNNFSESDAISAFCAAETVLRWVFERLPEELVAAHMHIFEKNIGQSL